LDFGCFGGALAGGGGGGGPTVLTELHGALAPPHHTSHPHMRTENKTAAN
jgi:hypothetical protein